MKKELIILVTGVVLVLIGVAGWWLARPFQIVRQLEARYQKVLPGMTTNEVQSIMNFLGRGHTDATYRGWGDITDSTTNTPHIGYAAAYTVPTFFMGVKFEFVFDENGKAVGEGVPKVFATDSQPDT